MKLSNAWGWSRTLNEYEEKCIKGFLMAKEEGEGVNCLEEHLVCCFPNMDRDEILRISEAVIYSMEEGDDLYVMKGSIGDVVNVGGDGYAVIINDNEIAIPSLGNLVSIYRGNLELIFDEQIIKETKDWYELNRKDDEYETL